MADRLQLESGAPDGYLLEDGTGDLLLDSLLIVNNANTTVTPLGSDVYSVEKTSGSAGTYDASAVSSLGMSGDFVLRIKNVSGATNYIAGVNSDPLTDDSYSSLDHGWLRVGDSFGTNVSVYENGASVAGPFAESTYSWIWRLGSSLGYGRGATLAIAQASPDRTVTDTATLYFDSSLTDAADKFEVTFYFPNLTGQSIVSAQGSATVTTTVALTGQSIAVARGTVLQGAPLVGQSVTAAQGLSTAGVAIALTGQSVTAGRGSVVAAPSFGLTGQSLSAAQGQVLQAAPLTGQSAVVAQGSTTPGLSLALTGQSVSVARGSVAGTASLALTSQSVVVARGSVTATASLALSGQAVTVSRGSLLAATSLALSGQALIAARGSLSATASFGLTGVGAVTARGTLAPTFDASLVGQSLIASQDTLLPSSLTGLLGQDLVVSRDSVQVGGTSDVTVALTGVAAVIAQGSLTAEGVSTYLFWQPGPLIGRRRSVSRSR